MYVRLAKLATKSEGYDRALQLLARAQSLEPFRAVPDLNIISLVSRCPLHRFMLMHFRYVVGGLIISCLTFVGKCAKYCMLLDVSVRWWSHSRQLHATLERR